MKKRQKFCCWKAEKWCWAVLNNERLSQRSCLQCGQRNFAKDCCLCVHFRKGAGETS